MKEKKNKTKNAQKREGDGGMGFVVCGGGEVPKRGEEKPKDRFSQIFRNEKKTRPKGEDKIWVCRSGFRRGRNAKEDTEDRVTPSKPPKRSKKARPSLRSGGGAKRKKVEKNRFLEGTTEVVRPREIGRRGRKIKRICGKRARTSVNGHPAGKPKSSLD